MSSGHDFSRTSSIEGEFFAGLKDGVVDYFLTVFNPGSRGGPAGSRQAAPGAGGSSSGTTNSGGNSGGPPATGRGSSSRRTPVQGSSGAGRRGSGAARGGGGDEPEEDEDGNEGAAGAWAGDPSKLLLACPFYKHNRFTHEKCLQMRLVSVHRLKQHIYRKHLLPVHCPRCYELFDDESAKLEHQRRESGCPVQARPAGLTGITDLQRREIQRRSISCRPIPELWNGIFAVIFPGAPLPRSPYVELTVSRESLAVIRAFRARWRPVFAAFAPSRLPPEFLDRANLLEAFMAEVVDDTLTRILDGGGGGVYDSGFVENDAEADGNHPTGGSSAGNLELLLDDGSGLGMEGVTSPGAAAMQGGDGDGGAGDGFGPGTSASGSPRR